MVLFETENSFASSPTVKSLFAFMVIIISISRSAFDIFHFLSKW